MKYYSTNRQTHPVSFRDAVIKGLPDDNGLFMPEQIPALPEGFIDDLSSRSLIEIGYTVAKPFVKEDLNEEQLLNVIEETLSFPIPLVKVHDNVFSLELFHGPTCAFKDVGARFLARCLGCFSVETVTVLVATSGDTGSAVASGFLGVPNVEVLILYPKGKVSHLQEQQLTTHGQNITALEVDGTFDDCQQLVKSAFLDKDIGKKIKLTSANSINIARLIPQSFYYFGAVAQLRAPGDVYISVPSGNYGNLTAGLLAKKMGLDIKGFIASSNINDIVPGYLSTGRFKPKPSQQTMSNAMDVGNPSNFNRLLELYDSSWKQITANIRGYSFNDKQTSITIKKVFEEYNYTLDPHGAVGYMGLQAHPKRHPAAGIFLETAHPAKFIDTIKPIIGEIEIPERLRKYLQRQKESVLLKNNFKDLKEYLLYR